MANLLPQFSLQMFAFALENWKCLDKRCDVHAAFGSHVRTIAGKPLGGDSSFIYYIQRNVKARFVYYVRLKDGFNGGTQPNGTRGDKKLARSSVLQMLAQQSQKLFLQTR